MTPIEVHGKYNKAIIYANTIDSAVIGQITALLNQESSRGSSIRIMPDTHAGAGCVIGTTMTLNGKVIPNLIGDDIACGMHVAKLKEKRVELPKFDSIIRKEIPSGYSIRETNHKYCNNLNIEKLKCSASIYYDRAYHGIGTLGGGNHFIELDRDDEGNVYLVVHTGSRHIGSEVAKYYQKAAWNKLKSENVNSRIPIELAYCEGDILTSYIHDMKILQEYAYWNRKAIVDTICKSMKLHIVEEFETVHNYIDTDNMILRKGAISAKHGEQLIIPLNMRDGSLLCVGKGNPEWNYSAPHGAGRIMSRSQAKETLGMAKYKKDMKEAGVYSTSVCRETIDECADAYKPMEDILDCISETVSIEKVIKPIYNYKESVDDERIRR